MNCPRKSMKLGIGKRGRIVICIIILNGELNVLKTVQLAMLLVNIMKIFRVNFKWHNSHKSLYNIFLIVFVKII